MRARIACRAVVALALIGVSGCATRGIQPREYVLSALSLGADPAASGALDVVVSVGPVQLPDYLRRQQVVRRARPNEVLASGLEVWGEDLAEGFTRVLGENVSLLVPTTRVVTFPAHEALDPDYRVIVVVERFEVGEDGAARLDARWRVAETGHREATVVRRSSLAEPAAGADTLAAVDALSRALAALSREIAEAIRTNASASPR
jgi:uncharacterized lipoprotein YmbA